MNDTPAAEMADMLTAALVAASAIVSMITTRAPILMVVTSGS